MLPFSEFVNTNKRDDQGANDVTHFFSRYFVNICAFPLYRIGLTPNQVTLIFIFTGIIGGALAFFDLLILSYFFWRAHIIIDMADGSVARVTKLFSNFGDILDKIGHHIIYPVYWIGFLYASGLLNQYPLLSLVFFATASSQWTIKHLFKDKNERPQAKNIIKRIVANAFGIEGFLIIIIMYSYLDVLDGLLVMSIIITSNLIMLFKKIVSLLKSA